MRKSFQSDLSRLRGSVNRRVANVTTVGQEAIQSFGELSGKKSSQPIDGSSYSSSGSGFDAYLRFFREGYA
jgi:hypothetical protein